MASISEILILIVIIICLLILPRFFKAQTPSRGGGKRIKLRFSPGLRAFIVVSIFLPVCTAFFFQPWKQNFHLFIIIGILPVLLAWSVFWIIMGFRNR